MQSAFLKIPHLREINTEQRKRCIDWLQEQLKYYEEKNEISSDSSLFLEVKKLEENLFKAFGNRRTMYIVELDRLSQMPLPRAKEFINKFTVQSCGYVTESSEVKNMLVNKPKHLFDKLEKMEAEFYTCPQCRSEETETVPKQTTAGDEIMTIYFKCLSCGLRRKIRN